MDKCSCGSYKVFTFFWAYNEYYCLNCGGKNGMSFAGGLSQSYKTNKSIKAEEWKEAVIKDVFNAFRKNLVPRSIYTKDNCKKCKIDGDHRKHLTEREKIKDAVASAMLEQIQGFWDKINTPPTSP